MCTRAPKGVPGECEKHTCGVQFDTKMGDMAIMERDIYIYISIYIYIYIYKAPHKGIGVRELCLIVLYEFSQI